MGDDAAGCLQHEGRVRQSPRLLCGSDFRGLSRTTVCPLHGCPCVGWLAVFFMTSSMSGACCSQKTWRARVLRGVTQQSRM